MGKKTRPSNYLDTYRAELLILDRALEEGSLILIFTTLASATTARHRLYKARLGDRERVQSEERGPGSPYDCIRVKMPKPSGQYWALAVVVTRGEEDIDGLLAIKRGS